MSDETPNAATDIIETPRSLRDQILDAQDIEAELVPVPQWNVTVEVRGMTGLERARFMEQFSNENGQLDYVALYPSLLTKTLYDPETGEQIFSDSDADFINAKSGLVLETLGKVATRLSGMSKDEEEATEERFQD